MSKTSSKEMALTAKNEMMNHFLTKVAERNKWKIQVEVDDTGFDCMFNGENKSGVTSEIRLRISLHKKSNKLVVFLFSSERSDLWFNTGSSTLGLKSKINAYLVGLNNQPDVSNFWIIEDVMSIVALFNLYDWFMLLHESDPIFNLPRL